MVSFFKEKSTSAVFSLIVVSAGIRAFFWVHPPQLIIAPGDGLMFYLLSPLANIPALLLPLLYQAIVVIQALRFNYALNDVRMFPKPAFTTALAYIMLTALLPAWNNISSALVTNTMLIWLLYFIIKLYNSQQPKTLIFNIGLITGSTVILYFAAFPLILVVFFTLAAFRPFRLNEWFILLMGILAPFYFLATWLFMNDKLYMALTWFHVFQPHTIIIQPGSMLPVIITFLMAGITIIAGIFSWQSNSGRMIIQVRKNWSVLFIMLLLLAPVVFLVKDMWPAALLLAAVPASAFISNTFLYSKKNIIPAIIFWIIVALVIYNNWFAAKI